MSLQGFRPQASSAPTRTPNFCSSPAPSPPALPRLPAGQESPKWMRTIFGARHISKSPLMQKVPCFIKGCERRVVRDGGMYCDGLSNYRKSVLPRAQDIIGPILRDSFPRLDAENTQRNRFCVHHTCVLNNCSRARIPNFPLCNSHLQRCTSTGCTRFAIRGTLCDAHFCTVVGCSDKRVFEGWCQQHARCEGIGCHNRRDKEKWPGTHCSNHALTFCNTVNCNRQTANHKRFCSVHQCSWETCLEARIIIHTVPSPCCAIHTCTSPGCRRIISQHDSQLCKKHVCQQPGCTSACTSGMPSSRSRSHYCNTHTCIIAGCSWKRAAIDKMGCPAHEELFPAPLITSRELVKQRLRDEAGVVAREEVSRMIMQLAKKSHASVSPALAAGDSRQRPTSPSSTNCSSGIGCSPFIARVANNGTTSEISGLESLHFPFPTSKETRLQI
ncbi:hypothetical protein CFIMG_002899RA [Ceratocystis fimbriata CBS 114723]|uniref:Uncharacterized protein n=1 Tax=Ceratocystis fimbriata CBS 114723 TaxID=1035309 RepID=A0A2C5XDQ0_9PEZI|nr:hypothetical protein CFIMG_002899RA [Ceratocystis fimbriata CBS 114723]